MGDCGIHAVLKWFGERGPRPRTPRVRGLPMPYLPPKGKRKAQGIHTAHFRDGSWFCCGFRWVCIFRDISKKAVR